MGYATIAVEGKSPDVATHLDLPWQAEGRLVSMNEYERLTRAETANALERLEAWLEESDQLAARILVGYIARNRPQFSVQAAW